QAEDGIRADLVTGVQTCALPISRRAPVPGSASRGRPSRNPAPVRRLEGSYRTRSRDQGSGSYLLVAAGACRSQSDNYYVMIIRRSEERRVGKTCGCREKRDGE